MKDLAPCPEPTVTLASLSEEWGFWVPRWIEHLDGAALLSVQEALLKVRAEALVAEPMVRNDEGWGNSEWALDQLAEATGQPWRVESNQLEGVDLLEAIAAVVDQRADWTERLEGIMAIPGANDYNDIFELFQRQLEYDRSDRVLKAMRALRCAFGESRAEWPKEHWWPPVVSGLVSDYYTGLKRQKLLDGIDKKELKEIRRFMRTSFV